MLLPTGGHHLMRSHPPKTINILSCCREESEERGPGVHGARSMGPHSQAGHIFTFVVIVELCIQKTVHHRGTTGE